MRILVINYEYPPVGGGGGFVTKDILEYMARGGCYVCIVTTNFRGLKRHEWVNGVDVHRVPVLLRKELEVATLPSLLSYFPSSLLYATLNLSRRNFDIVNTHFTIPSGPAGYLLSKIHGIPNVLTIHGGDIFDPSKKLSPHRTPFLSTTVQFLLNKADRVVAQSTDTKNNAYQYYSVNREIDIIPLGIKRPVYHKKSRTDYNLRKNEVILCTIGRLIKRKNIGELIQILAEIANDLKFKLIVIGEGPERPYLESKIRDLSLEDRIRLVGNVDDTTKFQFLDIADIYVSTALHEGFGLVFLEAMACGLPIICYDEGGQRDFLASGKTGFLIKFGDKRSFAEKIMKIANSQRLRNNVRAFNKIAINDYYIDTCAEKYLALFEDEISRFKSCKSSRKRKIEQVN